MTVTYLEFESEIKDLENKLIELESFSDEKGIDLSLEIEKITEERDEKLKLTYKNLTSWQKVMVARHAQRPYTMDYIDAIAKDFVELHGDRLCKDDHAIIGGLGNIDGQNFMIIGHQRGRTTEEKIYRNFGMANPDGYRKALRLMKMAERFKIPVLTFIDTVGAYPGVEAEERGQGEAIARNLLEMAGLKVPSIAVIIGEGGSGGALGLGVADRVLMLENSIYSVISPEGCASILFRDGSKAEQAAEILKIDAKNLLEMKIIDGIIVEPVGGAHRNYSLAIKNLKEKVLSNLEELKLLSLEELLDSRYEKYRSYGRYE